MFTQSHLNPRPFFKYTTCNSASNRLCLVKKSYHCALIMLQYFREVEQWFKALISDEDVLKDLKLDINMFAKIVAETGAAVTNMLNFIAKSSYKERSVLEIGILRYPDMDNPYFKVYRVELKAWSKCDRVLARETNSNGITGDYHCRKFKPRESVISQLKQQTRVKAVAVVDDLFDD